MGAVDSAGNGVTCRRCGRSEPEVKFYRDKTRKSGRAPYCNLCQNEYARTWGLGNREKKRLALAAWAARNPEKVKAQQHRNDHVRRLRRLGLTLQQYESMLEAQGGFCAICGQVESDETGSGRSKRLAIDHDHTTGEVRGLLCSNCNKGLGNFQDDLGILESAYVYLGMHKLDIKVVGGGCATCGCLQPENRHGDDRNITVSELKTSAHDTAVAPKHTATAMRNVKRTLRVARRRK